MNIQVTPHTIAITINTNINAGEYNITPCEFTFTEEYENLTKEAIFSSCDGSVIKTSILNNQCTIPFEVLQQEGNVLLGVYAYETDNDELVLRYSPTPQYFNVKKGSFQVGNDPDLPSPTEWERVLEQINQAIEETNNLNITANKEGKVTTVTITKKDGTTQQVEIEDGKSLEFKWQGTSLGVRQEGQSQYQYTDLQGPKGDAGAIHMIIVQTLPTEDIDESAIYLVPLENPTEEGNNYAEYVYINNQWELLGKIGVHVDLTDYVKNTDYATNSTGGVVKIDAYAITKNTNGNLMSNIYNYSTYSTASDNSFISKGTLENVLTAKIGDIQTLLDNLNTGNGV